MMKFSIFNCRARRRRARCEMMRSLSDLQFSNKGFTFIDVLVGTALMLIVFLGIFGAFQLGLRVVGQSKNKIIATAIANQQIEMIRNLPYESVGAKEDFPDGILEAVTITKINNIEYVIETRVDFVVDSADGIALPEDECPNDYKRVEIKVSWAGFLGEGISLTTDIAPKNIAQECAIIGGILSVLVFNNEGIIVPFPLIEVKDPTTSAIVKTAIPGDGKYYFSLPTDTYKIVVSKSGYSTGKTYGTNEIVTPEKPHPVVLEGRITGISFAIDKLSSMRVETRGTKELGYPVIPNITLTLTGEKIIGTDADENPVYKYSQNHITNVAGEITISNLEWDSYSFFIDPTTGLDLIKIESPPGATTTQPVVLPPDSVKEVRLILKAENSLLVTIQDMETLEPIFAASATLSNPVYSKTQYIDKKGQTYFIPLVVGAYNLNVSAPGYLATSTPVEILGDKTTIIKLELAQPE